MKEEDARKKWCPMVRITQLSHMISTNRESFKMTDTDKCDRCLASDCAMWVQAREPNRFGERIVDYEEGGHCGLIKQ